jgi:hypothetical protein
MGSSVRLYHVRLERGDCGGCGARPFMPGKTRCKVCDDRRKVWWRKNHPVARSRDPFSRQRASEKYRMKYPERCKSAGAKHRYKLRQDILDGYRRKCACCGETEEAFLTIDHVNNNGAAHRRSVKGENIYRSIRKNNYPPEYQLLCMNCNWAKRVGECPHKRSEYGIGIAC